MPPVGMMMVVLPAFIASRTSSHVALQPHHSTASMGRSIAIIFSRSAYLRPCARPAIAVRRPAPERGCRLRRRQQYRHRHETCGTRIISLPCIRIIADAKTHNFRGQWAACSQEPAARTDRRHCRGRLEEAGQRLGPARLRERRDADNRGEGDQQPGNHRMHGCRPRDVGQRQPRPDDGRHETSDR